MKEAFRTDGNWYKGNLHMHTLRSDGHLSPEQAVSRYQKAGYDFAALTDHWIQNECKTTERFLLLSGCEWDTGDMVNTPVFHIVGVGMDSKVSLERSLPPQKIIDAINAANGIAILAHPAWSVTNPADCLGLTGLGGVEIYNSVSGLPWNGERADSGVYIDIWASMGKFFPCMAADDSHFYQGEETRSYIMVNARELTPDSIKSSIRNGDFYASQGPEFHSVRFSGDAVRVESSCVDTIIFNSNTVWCQDRVFTGGVTGATYRMKPTDKYVRVILIDSQGRKAWCSPIPVNGEPY
ncbi:CehA/McbA family metallohydrolase domain-containing protein [Caproicibacter fermentans]|uniref:Polymerase/histidinol phosphatase N-terminal domain-containing protein n=1 Tax=Caproicibacter fermentans TaxID=2576756 RepID=A0A7G8TDI3_9FIRM|nr:hypothetical protein [Caproicibacter fermentans]QNK41674.1 hypothetical protein HCR03_05315 [Caproicibacter fermentans]